MGILITRTRLRDGTGYVSWSEDTLHIAGPFTSYLAEGTTFEILDYVPNPTFGVPNDVRDKCQQWRRHFNANPS